MSPVVRKMPLPTVAPMVISTPSQAPSERTSAGLLPAVSSSGAGGPGAVTGAHPATARAPLSV